MRSAGLTPDCALAIFPVQLRAWVKLPGLRGFFPRRLSSTNFEQVGSRKPEGLYKTNRLVSPSVTCNEDAMTTLQPIDANSVR
jgi:hypothetical protein